MDEHYITCKHYIHLWVLLLLSTSIGGAKFFTFQEGNIGIMTFHYDSPSIRKGTVQIFRSHRLPFYIDGNISNAGLTDTEVGRFTVIEHENTDLEKHKLSILVQISNVTRSDAGSYVCSVRENGKLMAGFTKRVGLTVNFPPGKASCHFIDETSEMDKEWTKLECIAPLGNYFGFINCYQIEGKMPHLSDVTHNRTHLRQMLLVRKYKPAMCCTTNYERPTKDCACNDFLWDPLNQNLTTLCPKEEANFEPVITDPSMRNDHMSSSAATLTQQQKNFSTEAGQTQNQCSDVRAIWFVTGGLVSTAIIMAAVWFACHMKRINYMSPNAKQSPEKDHHKSTASENKYIATEEQPTHVMARKTNKFTKSRQKLTPEHKNEEGQFRQVGTTFRTL